VTFNDSADDGQANAGPFKIVDTVQTLENLKQLISILQVEAGAVVANENRNHSIFFVILAPDDDLRFGNLVRVLHRVGEQIDQH
jgi:hypothetical protein